MSFVHTDWGSLEPACVVVCPERPLSGPGRPYIKCETIATESSLFVSQNRALHLIYSTLMAMKWVFTLPSREESEQFMGEKTKDHGGGHAAPQASEQGCQQMGRFKWADVPLVIWSGLNNAQHHTYWHWPIPPTSSRRRWRRESFTLRTCSITDGTPTITPQTWFAAGGLSVVLMLITSPYLSTT